MSDSKDKNAFGKLKKRAEILVRSNPSNSIIASSDVDNAKVLHELEVSRTELELQNEELRQALKEAQVANNRYAELYDHSPIGFITLTSEGRILDLNLPAAKLFGKEQAKLRNSQFGFFLAEDHRENFIHFLEHIFNSNTSQNSDFMLSVSKGSFPRFINLSGIRNGNAEQCRVVMHDITDRKQAHQKLADSEQRFRSYFELPFTGRAITSPGKGWIEVNQALCDMLGYTKPELIRTNWADLTHPDDLEADLLQFNRVVSNQIDGYSLCKRFIHKDGHPVYTNVAVQCVRHPDLQVDYCVAIILDISELEKTEQTLNMQKKQYRDLFENSLLGILVIDREGTFRMVNPTAANKFGMTQDEVAGKSIHDLIGQEKAQEYIEFNRTLMDSGGQREYEDSFLMNGVERTFLIFDKALDNENGSCDTMLSTSIDITERKVIQEHLIKSEKNLSETERIGKTGSWDYDVATDTANWSENMFRIFDVDPEMPKELVFKHFVENLVHPDDRVHVLSVFADAISGKRPYDLEYRVVNKNGIVSIIHAVANTVRDEKGHATRLIGKVEDITEPKRLENVYNFLITKGYPGSDENFFESLAKYLSDILGAEYICIDKLEGEGLTAQTVAVYNEGKFDVNVSYTLKQTPCGEVVGKTICSFPENVCQLFPYDEALQELKAQSYIGTTLWSFDGRPIGLIAVIGQKPMNNVVFAEEVLKIVAIRSAGELERIQVADELRLAKEKAEENEARLKMAQEVSKSGSWEWDILKNAFYWSDEFLKLFGLPENTVAGFEAWTKALHPDDVEIASRRIQEAIENRTPLLNDYRIILPGYEHRWIRSTGQTTYVNDTPVRMIVMCMDITNQKMVETEIRNLNENLEMLIAERTHKLEEINKELTFHINEVEQFTYIASHDLQEPLRTLINYTDLLHKDYGGKPDEELEKYLNFISGSAYRMKSLVTGLLEYSILGKESVMTLVDCNKIVHEVLLDLSDSIVVAKPDITLGSLPVINGYATELRLLFQNLIANAIKFRNNDVLPEIAIACENREREWLFSISDNGIGIKEQDKEKVFIIFKRMQNQKNFPGTGIGLAHCKKIVELHKGRIWVDSIPGAGSTFRFTIPKR